jgi:hypothetical protein
MGRIAGDIRPCFPITEVRERNVEERQRIRSRRKQE